MTVQVQVTFDAGDPAALARFWAHALGYVEQPPPPGVDSWEELAAQVDMPPPWPAAIVDPEGRGPRLFFQPVPEGKQAKNRVHLDVNVGAGEPPERRADVCRERARDLVALGAVLVCEVDQHGEFWIVMQDPEGNEFCLQ